MIGVDVGRWPAIDMWPPINRMLDEVWHACGGRKLPVYKVCAPVALHVATPHASYYQPLPKAPQALDRHVGDVYYFMARTQGKSWMQAEMLRRLKEQRVVSLPTTAEMCVWLDEVKYIDPQHWRNLKP